MKIEKTECSYQVTECDLKFGEQITLDGELLIPASKIRAEIEQDANRLKDSIYWDGLRYAIDILDEYNTKSKDIDAEAQATEFLAEARSCGVG